jgi:hypothetical protein
MSLKHGPGLGAGPLPDIDGEFGSGFGGGSERPGRLSQRRPAATSTSPIHCSTTSLEQLGVVAASRRARAPGATIAHVHTLAAGAAQPPASPAAARIAAEPPERGAASPSCLPRLRAQPTIAVHLPALLVLNERGATPSTYAPVCGTLHGCQLLLASSLLDSSAALSSAADEPRALDGGATASVSAHSRRLHAAREVRRANELLSILLQYRHYLDAGETRVALRCVALRCVALRCVTSRVRRVVWRGVVWCRLA